MKKLYSEQVYKQPEGFETISAALGVEYTESFRFKPQKKALILNTIFSPFLFIVLVWICIDVGFIIGMTFSGIFTDIPWIMAIIIPFFALHLAPVWIYIISIIQTARRAKFIEYALTESALYVQLPAKKGKTTIRVISFRDIISIELRKGVIDRACKVGDIVFDGINRLRINDVENPEQIYQKIRNSISAVSPIIKN